jgi:hypothetical protein
MRGGKLFSELGFYLPHVHALPMKQSPEAFLPTGIKKGLEQFLAGTNDQLWASHGSEQSTIVLPSFSFL